MKISDLAAQSRRDPWVLTDDSGSPLVTIPQPDVSTWAQLADADTIVDVVRILAGDQFDALMAQIGACGAPALQQAADDMRKAFGLGN